MKRQTMVRGAVVLSGLLSASLLSSVHTVQGTQSAAAPSEPAGPRDTWARSFGSPFLENALTGAVAPDGAIFVAGFTDQAVFLDALLTKVDARGNLLWTRVFGSAGIDLVESMACDDSGGCLLVGETSDAPPAALWLVKLDLAGDVQWERKYGPGEQGSVVPLPDGGWLLTATHRLGLQFEVWLLRIDADGELVHSTTYAGIGDRDYGCCAAPTDDGGYVVAGNAYSDVGGLKGDPFLLKLDGAGNVQWQRFYDLGAGVDEAVAVQANPDGGFLIVGSTTSLGAGGTDAWIARTDAFGDLLWQNTYGGPLNDGFADVLPTDEGGWILAGTTIGGVWLLELDGDGAVVWEKTYGGSGPDRSVSLSRTQTGRLVVTGDTQSFAPAPSDLWVLKLTENGQLGPCSVPGMGVPAFSTVAPTAVVPAVGSAAMTSSLLATSISSTYLDGSMSATEQCGR